MLEFENKRKVQILKIIKHREKQISTARKINLVLKRENRRGISYILIPGPSAYEDPDTNIYDVGNMWRRIQVKNGKDR